MFVFLRKKLQKKGSERVRVQEGPLGEPFLELWPPLPYFYVILKFMGFLILVHGRFMTLRAFIINIKFNDYLNTIYVWIIYDKSA